MTGANPTDRENAELRASLALAEATIAEQQRELAQQVALSRTDALTGLANRRAFDSELARRLDERERTGTPACLLLFDVDHFKKFNDRHGHTAGDYVLSTLAQALADVVRTMDLVARYGGEEFAIIMPTTQLNEASSVGERIRRAVEACVFRIDELELKVTISVGVAQLHPGELPEALIRRADTALYAAKGAGRNCVRFHDGMRVWGLGPKAALAAISAEPLSEGREMADSLSSLCDDLRIRLAEVTGAQA
jgi:diguanylate cyclase (GGDEF)-like protein